MLSFSEEELRAAAKEVSLAWVDRLPEARECQYVFSRHFERKMNRLLRRTRHPTLSRGLRRVACFFLALLIGGIVWLSVDAEAREAFFGWVSEWTEGSRHYYFEGTATQRSAAFRYVYPEIPQGYSAWDVITEEGTAIFVFVDEDGRFFKFEYLQNTGTETFLLTQRTDKHDVKINGHHGEFIPADSPEHSNVVAWTDEETGTLLFVHGFFDEEYLIHWAEGVRRIEVPLPDSEQLPAATPNEENSEGPDQYSFTGETVLVSDGTEVEIWSGPSGQSYRLKNGCELLRVKEARWEDNIKGDGMTAFDSLNQAVQDQIRAYLASLPPSYDVEEHLERAYRAAPKQKKEDPDFVWTLTQELCPEFVNDKIVSVVTRWSWDTEQIGAVFSAEQGFVFDCETGEHIENLDLFICPSEDVPKRVLDLAYVDDTVSRAALEKAFRSESILLCEDGLELEYPPGSLTGVGGAYSLVVKYEETQGLICDWALPKCCDIN